MSHSQEFKPRAAQALRTLLLMVSAFALTHSPAASLAGSRPDRLVTAFINPPPESRPWVYWWWMGRVSRESITRDLEALKAKGVGGVLIYHSDDGTLPDAFFGPTKLFWSPQWAEMVQYAEAEAKRLGLGLVLNYTPGSAGCCEPWIDAEHSGQILVWSGVQAQGGSQLELALPQPEVREGFYRDVAVLAWPARGVWDRMRLAAPELKVSSQEFIDVCEPEAMLDGDPDSYWSSGAGRPGGEYVDLAFAKPFAAEAVFLLPRNGWTPSIVEVLASEDGQTYRSVARQAMPPDQPLTLPIPPTTSRFFRVAFPASQSPDGRVGVAELRLLTQGEDASRVAGLRRFAEQIANSRHSIAGITAMARAGDLHSGKPPDLTPTEVLDLTAAMDARGVLRWKAPPGDWEILRFGRTSLGFRARVDGPVKGYHVDYLDPEMMKLHFTRGVDPLLKTIGYRRGSALLALHEDSFEMPFNRWTAAFAGEFRKRRGYDPRPWMPVLAGRVVESPGASERFLWDYRRTIGDLYLTHWETAQRECHRRGLKFESEAAGPVAYCFDALAQLARTDIPMGEFWSGIYRPGVAVDDQPRGCWNSPECETIRQTASAAHLVGQPIVAAESFTGYSRPFVLDPFDIKAMGDRALCDGVNRFVVHLCMTQPMEEHDGKPVVVRLHAFDYNRRTTWFEQSRFWTDYLARCSAMLQAGRPVADVCVFLGEGAPALVPQREFSRPPIPAAYAYDACNGELLQTARFSDGRIRFPSGANYAVLALPPDQRSMTPALLRHVADLVRAGAPVLGPKPMHSPSLSDRPAADQQVERLADELWGSETSEVGQHACGKGRIFWGQPLEDVLAAVGCPPACAITGEGAREVLFIERRTGEGDLFFLSNQAKEIRRVTVALRARGSVMPEWWDPATGDRRPIRVYQQDAGTVRIPLTLDQRASGFIVLRPAAAAPGHWTELVKDGASITPGLEADIERTADGDRLVARASGRYELQHSDATWDTIEVPPHPDLRLASGWTLQFPGQSEPLKLERLVSWTELAQPEWKAFSGTATYRNPFPWAGEAKRVELDLGAFKNIAEVVLNGRSLGLLWKPPYRLDVSAALRNGENLLEVRITNLLVNRISADMLLPLDQRQLLSFGAIDQYRPGLVSGQDGLLPSGLFGPVVLRVVPAMPLRAKTEKPRR